MLDELKEEGIVNKVGGRFKLSTLIQKRMVALNTGARPLVDVRGGDRLQTVVQEILQDKIYLDLEGNLKTREAYETDGTVSPSQAFPAPASRPDAAPSATPAPRPWGTTAHARTRGRVYVSLGPLMAQN